jgi:SAM-dependent methyltransferase
VKASTPTPAPPQAGSAKAQGDLWGSAAKDWSELSAAMVTPLYHAALNLARVGRGTTLLDVGCGSGEVLALAHFRGADAIGIDAAPALVHIARQRAPHADVREGDMEDLPYKDESVDAITYVNTLQFARDPGHALREGARVLAPGGRLVAAVWAEPERCGLARVMKAVADALPQKPPGGGPFSLSAPTALADLVKQAGLKPVETVEVPTPFLYFNEDHAIGSILSTGPAQGAIRAVGAGPIRRAALAGLEPFRRPDGTFAFDNVMRCVVATSHP